VKRSILYVLVALMLALGAAFVACGGGGDKSNKEEAQPTASQQQDDQAQQEEDTPEAESTPEKKATSKSSGGGSSGSIGDVPIYPGAKETDKGEWSGSEAIIPSMGSDVDAGNYTKVQYGMYETEDAAGDVFDWYKDKMGDWKEEGTFSSGSGDSAGAFGVWTKDDGKEAVWITISEDSGTTTLAIFYGSQ